MKKMKLFFAIFSLLLLLASYTFAQQLPASINVDQLSDQQLIQLLSLSNTGSMTEAELEAKASEKGLNADQIQKLKLRMISASSNAQNASRVNADTSIYRNAIPTRFPKIILDSSNILKVYGSELFSKENLTFEPNLQIATPKNYEIGTGDQLIIDLFGYSDANFKLKVTTEGMIRIPNVGPVKVAGLNFEDAQNKIRAQLSKIYPQIQTGKTSVQVSLGQIRSIRVTLIGEVERPGTYSLSSLSNLANALYASGGPNKIGSFRNIDLIRNGKVFTSFDLYDFLQKGDRSKNVRLEDDDIIKVNPYDARFIITGAVKRKAIYEAKKTETLKDMLSIAGGFSDNAYQEFIRLVRNGKNSKESITVKADQFAKFYLQAGDSCFIDSISSRFTNRVVITGAVYHPGVYSIQEFSTLKPLLQIAGIKEEAYLQRGFIKRKNENYLPKAIDVNISDILSGKSDIPLQREDSIRIFSLLELRAKDSVTINGEVNKPGAYNFADSMQLQDLILLAGGFNDGASNAEIEVARRIKNTNIKEAETDTYAIVNTIALNKILDKTANLPVVYLQPYDIVSVRKDPAYKEQITVEVQGEVLYPGKYTVQNNKESISDLVKRAGGLRTTAYAEGGMLLRNTFSDTIESNLSEDRIQTIKNQTKGVDSLSNSLINSISRGKKIVNISLQLALEKPNSFNDIKLQAGDVLRIPRFPETVQSFGAVYVSKKIVYSSDLSFKKIIDESGGFLVQAARKKCYVMYPNGEIKTTNHFIFFKSYPKIKPGTEIYVPLKTKRNFGLTELAGITALVTGLLTTMVFIKSL
jgi:protein involved in polysaccharide export with SLBB domain